VAFKIRDPQQTTEKEFFCYFPLMNDVRVRALESIANTLADGGRREHEF